MGFWDWMDKAVGCIPVVGTIKDSVEAAVAGIEGHPREAREKLLDACVGLVCDVATVASFGAASEITVLGKAAAEQCLKSAAITYGENALKKGAIAGSVIIAAGAEAKRAKREFKQNHQRKGEKKENDDNKPKPKPKKPDEPDKKRGDHVINLDVIKICRKILDQFLENNSRYFYGNSFADLVQRGYIPENSVAYSSYFEPFNANITAGLTSMVVDLNVPSPNDTEYGQESASLRVMSVHFMMLLFQYLLLEEVRDREPIIIDGLRNIWQFVRTDINQVVNQLSQGVYVDDLALAKWLQNGGNRGVYEQRRNAVKNMFSNFSNGGRVNWENSNLVQWVRTLYSAYEQLKDALQPAVGTGSIAHHLVGISLIAINHKDDDEKYDGLERVAVGHQTDGAGTLYAAVALTEWGKIPGKAKESTCWYSYGGKEYVTKQFQWLTSEKRVNLVENLGFPPPRAVLCGFQTDGAGDLYAAVAKTPYGRVPGKAKADTCWYPYGGKEYSTKDFDWVVKSTKVLPSPMITLEKKPDSLVDCLQYGFQTDGAGALYCAVAHTEFGDVPGKAKGDTCWYPYGGKEYTTADFSLLHSTIPLFQVGNWGEPPIGALMVGRQKDRAGVLYAAVANTKWGKIPGKAKGKTCWYPYGGKEIVTEDFKWISTHQH